ncbi:unnamed protein product, partial [Rotaria socialis]
MYVTHDIEDEIDETQGYIGLGDDDFVHDNLLLLWILSPLSPPTMQICIVIGFILNVQISIMFMNWIGCLSKEYLSLLLSLSVIFISAYALIIDCILQNLDVDNV